MYFSESEENYIKEIYHIQAVQGTVSTNALAGALGARAASVTEMLKKLQKKKLINYKPYKNFSLTELGNRIALEVVRKHRLWEYFLVHKLGFSWHEVHDIAEEMEHVSSRELIQRLDHYLGSPAFDPHGDPIPDKNGKLKAVKQNRLTDVPLRKWVIVNALKEQGGNMHQLLKHYDIHIGTRLKVNKRFDFDSSLEIKMDKLPPAIISGEVAKNIYCTI
ncbi:MAG: metal-dependent transcriptional regulator [Niastella sp.]|nr:metal-dependent transcriptional regulator [Niastella sp.]